MVRDLVVHLGNFEIVLDKVPGLWLSDVNQLISPLVRANTRYIKLFPAFTFVDTLAVELIWKITVILSIHRVLGKDLWWND